MGLLARGFVGLLACAMDHIKQFHLKFCSTLSLSRQNVKHNIDYNDDRD